MKNTNLLIYGSLLQQNSIVASQLVVVLHTMKHDWVK